MSRLLRILVLASGLPLMLPPGWCCMLQPAAKAASAPASRTCCGCQKCGGEKSPGPKAPAPASRHCPCNDRDATAPTVQKSPVVVACFACVPLAPIPAVWSAEQHRLAATPTLDPSISLHVLNCTWRC